MAVPSKLLAGPGFIILNSLLLMNVAGLLVVICARVVMLVKIDVHANFFFFDACTHVLSLWISLLLIASELSLFPSYFARTWPLLSIGHGFVALGSAMLALGVSLLGNLNKPAFHQGTLGMPCWRLLVAAGTVIIILGIFNLVANYVFGNRSHGVTARQVRAKGATAINIPRPISTVVVHKPNDASAASLPQPSNKGFRLTLKNVLDSSGLLFSTHSIFNSGTGTSGEDSKPISRLFSVNHPRRPPTLPSYHTILSRGGTRSLSLPPSPRAPSSSYSVRTREDSFPSTLSPTVAGLVRPELAWRPAMTSQGNFF